MEIPVPYNRQSRSLIWRKPDMFVQDNRGGLISRKDGIFGHSGFWLRRHLWLVKSAPIAYIPDLFLME
jgi:hypothetical protein